MATAAVSLSAIPADAAVGGGRAIEVQTGSNLVILDRYPANTEVLVEVIRQGFVIGTASNKSTDADGLLELNHVGVTDCFDGPSSPDIAPGDTIRATLPDGTQDTSLVRGVFIDDVQFGVPTASDITVTGSVALSGRTRVVPGTDVLELRINKDSPWDVNDRPGRVDRREDIGASVDPDGSWTHVISASVQDVNEAEAGSEVFLEWSAGAAGEEEVEASEITVAEPAGPPAEAIDCPPLQEGPTAPQLLRAQDSGNKGDHITNRSTDLTFRGLAGSDIGQEGVEPGSNAEVTLFVNGTAGPSATANANGVYRFTGINLTPRKRAHSLKVVAKDAGDAPAFDSVVRRVKVDTRLPRVVLRRLRPTPLHLEGRERLQAVYRIGESSRLDAKIQRRTAKGWRNAKAYRDRNVKGASRVQYFWNGKTATRRDVRPGRYRMLLTVTDKAGNQTVHKQSRFRVRR